ncbi:Dolichyl-diphosphooligosaccharide-protein glycosyltransferase subunit dad1 [Conoideocrella luteorostrata]|uniref:DASH complex subunit DAD1 n=1 Tax=Conoideocrella luteorostrata TaxID=1105319 RepID=A0AAJ0CU76_9HYPO|nr:Dolichyl-diphosphooligosaccharide-protein glycosyltransferase subunit dad1 [Conoideocrella luteorostrata]
MAKRQRTSDTDREKTYFEQQREALVSDIAMSLEHVLANINKLNRSLEDVIKMGNDFSSVEALWSQFENVMAKDDDDAKQGQSQGQEQSKEKSEGHERGDQ